MKQLDLEKEMERARKPRLTAEQVAEVVRQRREGVPVIDICYQHRVSTTSVYNWTRNAGKREREADQPLFK